MGLVLSQEEARELAPLFSVLQTYKEKSDMCNLEEGPHQNPELRLPVSRTVRNKFLLFKPSTLNFVMSAALNKVCDVV